MISSILFRASPDVVKLLMVDPKRVELSGYDGIPHLISPVVTDPKKAAIALRWAVGEMERRYEIFAETGVRNIDMYLEMLKSDSSEEPKEHLPYIVIIVDELADLMMVAAAEVEDAICRLAQMARAAGMYLIIATQRPSVDVITGLIKANVPSRIAFAVSSQVDSRTILDMGGAERLIGKGDMLYYPIGASKPTRAQGAWISDQEVEALVRYWRQQGEPDYQEEVVEEAAEGFSLDEHEEDELLPDAIRLVVENGQASISMLQRRFRIGYSRAARLIDAMELRGIVGPYQGSKPREVLADSTILEER
jgi:S-DNA-T family DNA segregation ATPase FtsK/SpoIIIE